MFTIEMLPAAQGDCLWIEYGTASDPKRVLIDGGVLGTYSLLKKRIQALSQPRFELIIATHVDRDHIEGILRVLNDPAIDLDVGDIWFNGHSHISDPDRSILDVNEDDPDDMLGPEQGEYFSALIAKERILKDKWNKAFGGKAVAITNDGLPTKQLDGGLSLTLLSPMCEAFDKFQPIWKKKLKGKFTAGDFDAALKSLAHRRDLQPEVDDMLGDESGRPNVDRLVKKPFEKDKSEANDSSIAVLVSYKGNACLFAGDAHALTLERSIETLLDQSNDLRLSLDAFKISHHGGKKNLSASLLQLLDCKRYLISTNGAYYDHPDQEAIARIIRYGGKKPSLMFNYRVKGKNLVWDDLKLMQGKGGKDRYEVAYPPEGNEGLLISLE